MNPNMVLANNDPMAGVLRAIRDILHAGVRLGAEAADELQKVLEAFDGLTSERIERTAVTKPVCRYLADALAIADTTECGNWPTFAQITDLHSPATKCVRTLINAPYNVP